MIFSIIYISGVLISALAQILLKKSANEEKESRLKEYLNARTLLAYGIFFGATLCSVFAYKYIPLSFGPILGSLEYIFIAVLSYLCLKEKISKKRLIGLLLIIAGVIIFSI